ncbi:hypothetical protein D5R81_02540 [Parashewanella spongiae]|uniref:Lipoprotein n=1 Tax=Parashewanella spongiae TaxID=342950 RepID=A0A3A6U107_9GAMM|nr:hypothetical protein [Parashewanella spongiae]MCL1078894.1 hypothetical protein [Parashewanella spongiae]RJY19056.1 hypothetical protein D5R81_02540 [Parashewanella spongiae]
MKLKIMLISSVLLMGCSMSENLSAQDSSKVDVYINDGSVQCMGGGKTVKQTERLLEKEGINVYSSTCGDINGMAVISVCGAGGLHINVHSIDEGKVPEAEKLGFKPVSLLKEGFTKNCKTKSRPSNSLNIQ